MQKQASLHAPHVEAEEEEDLDALVPVHAAANLAHLFPPPPHGGVLHAGAGQGAAVGAGAAPAVGAGAGVGVALPAGAAVGAAAVAVGAPPVGAAAGVAVGAAALPAGAAVGAAAVAVGAPPVGAAAGAAVGAAAGAQAAFPAAPLPRVDLWRLDTRTSPHYLGTPLVLEGDAQHVPIGFFAVRGKYIQVTCFSTQYICTHYLGAHIPHIFKSTQPR